MILYCNAGVLYVVWCFCQKNYKSTAINFNYALKFLIEMVIYAMDTKRAGIEIKIKRGGNKTLRCFAYY